MSTYVIALILGVGFGFALNKAGLTKYHKIVNVFRLTDLAVLKFMMTALVVSMSGLVSPARPGAGDLPQRPGDLRRRQHRRRADLRRRHGAERLLPRHLRGGRGEGKLDYLIPGLLGFLVGAGIYGLTYQQVFPAISAIANSGNVVIPDLWNLSPFLTVALFRADGGVPVLPDRPGGLASQEQRLSSSVAVQTGTEDWSIR